MISLRCECEDHGNCHLGNVGTGEFHCTCPCHSRSRKEVAKVTILIEDPEGNVIKIETNQYDYVEWGVMDTTPPPRYLGDEPLRTSTIRTSDLTLFIKRCTQYTMSLPDKRPAVEDGSIVDEPTETELLIQKGVEAMEAEGERRYREGQ